MKGIPGSTVIAGLIMPFILTLSLPAPAQVFKIATAAPGSMSWLKSIRSGMMEIKRRTEARVQFKIYPGGVQGDDQTVLKKMRIGQIQGGVLGAGSLARFYPDLQVYNLPLQFNNFTEVDYVRAHMDQYIIDGLYQSGIVSFPLVETGFAYILSRTPVRRVDDLKKISVWVPNNDPIVNQLVYSFGAKPVPLNITDVLPGLQTGLIDSVAVPPMVTIALQWHNQFEYLDTMPIMYIYSMLVIDRNSFNSIRKSDQQIVHDVLNPIFEVVGRNNRRANLNAYQALLNQGIKPIASPAQNVPAWQALAGRTVQALVKTGRISKHGLEMFNGYLDQVRATRLTR